MTGLGAPRFNALFDTFLHDVVRLETLPFYAVGGGEARRVAAWHAGLARPERSVRTDPWLARIATSTVVAGKSWRRVRVFDDPPTDYQRYQIESYREAQACGDQVVIASRGDVGETGPDVWLFDALTPMARAVIMHYRPDGSIERRELVENPTAVGHLAMEVARVAAQAVPLNEWLARAGVNTGA